MKLWIDFVTFYLQRYLLLVALVGFVSGADLEARAKLLASKTILNHFIVENKDLTVLYKIYNVGSSSAYNVVLNDVSFPASDFKVVKGQSSVQWNSIPPSGNVTHVLVLQPLKAGYFNFTAAQLSYDITDGGEKQVSIFLCTLLQAFPKNPVSLIFCFLASKFMLTNSYIAVNQNAEYGNGTPKIILNT